MDYMKRNIMSKQIQGKNQTPSFRRKSFDILEKTVSNIKSNKNKVVFVGISGGPASGKSKISNYFSNNIQRSVTICELSFLNPNEKTRNNNKDLDELIQDYDKYSKKRRLFLIDKFNPNSYDFNKFSEVLTALREGKIVKIPIFDEEKCEFNPRKEKIIDPSQTPLIIIDGYFICTNDKIKDFLNIKIFKEVEEDDRLARLVLREEHFLNRDKKAYEMFFKIYEKIIKTSYMDNIKDNINKSIVLPDYDINENDQLEIDETLEVILKYLIFLSKR